MSENNIVMHIDMDSFYASVEIRDRPDLKDKPVAVCSKTYSLEKDAPRGVISAASYPARKFGLHSAMSLAEALKLCPDVVLLPMNRDLYKQVSDNIIKIIGKHMKTVQQVSIDEAYALFPDSVQTYDDAKQLAQTIKNEIYAAERITCSAGIAPNKSTAKIASGYQKPNGMTIVLPENQLAFLSPLPVTKIPGVGQKTNEFFDLYNIKTVGDLAKTDKRLLFEKLGKQGLVFSDIANGIDNAPVIETADVKSISRFYSLSPFTADSKALSLGCDAVCEEVHKLLSDKKMFYKTVTISLRFYDFSTASKSKSHSVHVSDINTLKRYAQEMLLELIDNNTDHKKSRQISVGVSKLKKTDVNQMQLSDFF
ncbi:DNA polymerase IV [Methanosarcinaceae archaeon Ag5]|uniref:DNA polymerase IV n=1 Tax=Methanolapillus africanus TaxID=3028297 RepID=A0AAE4MJ05_9EURY|nr:DNA polymerase IV [Methanosarcinaceae archaeon Ag5]